MGPVSSPQTFGSVVLSASVSPSATPGQVVFYSDGNAVGTNTLSGGTVTLNVPAGSMYLFSVAGSPHTITAQYLGNGQTYPYYAGSVSTNSLPVTIQALTVHLGGSKTYDKTAAITPAQGLTIYPTMMTRMSI